MYAAAKKKHAVVFSAWVWYSCAMAELSAADLRKEIRKMKIMKKLLLLAMAVLLVLSLFAGCAAPGGDPEQDAPDTQDTAAPAESDAPEDTGEADAPVLPVIEAVDISGMELATADDGTVQVSYPADAWAFSEGQTPLTLMYAETDGTDQAVNVNIQAAGAFSGELTEADMDSLTEGLDSMGGYMSLQTAELRSLNGSPAIYMENVLQFTDEYIDLMLEQGVLDQETVDAMGRETLLSIPPTTQVMVYAVNNGELFVFVGTYYEEAQKDIVLDMITIMAQTCKAL